jgi:hypothetical protein
MTAMAITNANPARYGTGSVSGATKALSEAAGYSTGKECSNGEANASLA